MIQPSIDLRSDTITRPTSDMLKAMYEAKTGDDVFAEDPAAVELQERCAALFGHESALYCPSGTMTNQTFDECDPKHPMPVMQIHGAKDNTVPYEGNDNMKPIDDVMEFWVNYNACNVTPSEIIIEDNDDDGLGGTLSVYNGCMNDVSVELYYLDGLGHQWPSIKGTRVFDIDSASVIWEFFSKYNVDGSME